MGAGAASPGYGGERTGGPGRGDGEEEEEGRSRGPSAESFRRRMGEGRGGVEGKRGIGQAWNKEDININERTRKRRCKDV